MSLWKIAVMGNKRRTREELRRAIQRLVHGRPKRLSKDRCQLSISAVAREAGISASSIHNTYPDVAELIRAKVAQRPKNVDSAPKERVEEILRLARQQLRSAERDLVRIASENARLISENLLLKAQLRSHKVVLLPAKRRVASSAAAEG